MQSRMSASEISAEQSKHAERDAQSKLYQYRYNAMKCKHGADEKHDNEVGDEYDSESVEAGTVATTNGEEPGQRSESVALHDAEDSPGIEGQHRRVHPRAPA